MYKWKRKASLLEKTAIYLPVNTLPIFVGERWSVCNRVCSQIRSRLGADSVASGSRFGRVCPQIRSSLGADSDAAAPRFAKSHSSYLSSG